MSGISVSRLVAPWVRAVLVAGALGPSVALAQTTGTGTESASAESGAKPAAAGTTTDAFHVRAGVHDSSV